MFKNTPVNHSINYKHSKLSLSTGLLAKQATSSVLAKLGETTVLAAVVVGKKTDRDYLPLQVIYEERYYASGKIKSSRFVKREGRPSDKAVLTGRMIDRSLRSLFDDSIRNDIQVVITVLSIDGVHSPDTLAVLAASSALTLSGIEGFSGPVSSINIGINSIQSKEFLIQNIVQKIDSVNKFADCKQDLSNVCSVIDLEDSEDKKVFYKIFESVNKKNPSWIEKLKSLYRATPKKVMVGKSLVTTTYPEYSEQDNSQLELTVSGNGKSIVMVEAAANIIPEKVIGSCLKIANDELLKLTNFQKDFIEKATISGYSTTSNISIEKTPQKALRYWQKQASEIQEILYSNLNPNEKKTATNNFKEYHLSNVEKIIKTANGFEIENLSDIKEASIGLAREAENSEKLIFSINDILSELDEISELKQFKKDLVKTFDLALKNIFKTNILSNSKRFDGRELSQTRELDIQPGVLPHNHGSSLFSRGETQVLNSLTLGTLRDAMTVDGMEDFEEKTQYYIHHYNFPSYSVGETGRYFGPGRREIGHGALAEKALLPVLPSQDIFPYTIRTVSECLGSNGSTSMASTCASSLSLMQAGVPISDHVAGVAMGVVIDSETSQYKLITDIQGIEDHYGDMDFKITGTKDGITAIQLDNKASGLTADILIEALGNSKNARMHILEQMELQIDRPVSKLSATAPKVSTLPISVDKIADLIGPGGKTIKSIIERTGVEIDVVEEKKQVVIYSKNQESNDKAIEIISQIIKEYKLKEEVMVKVTKIEKFGAFVKIDNSDTEGLIHISDMSLERIETVDQALMMGQIVKARIIKINDRGQIGLELIDKK